MMKNLVFISTRHKEYDNLINNSEQFEDGCYNWHSYVGNIYMHGLLELNHGFDCVSLLSANDIQYERHTDSCGVTVERPMLEEGIYDCQVYGYPNPCKAFIWNSGTGGRFVKGLIVDANDATSVEYAKQKYTEKAYVI